MPANFLIKFNRTTGERENTIPYDRDITEAKAQELIADGYEIVSYADWNKLIGNYDGQEYVKDIESGQGYIPKPIRIPPLSEAKERKIAELKTERDTREMLPVEYNGSSFDFDQKSYERITAAIYALDLNDGSIEWTTSDNDTVIVTANILRCVIAAAAARSNDLHIRYRELKALVAAAQSNEAVETIMW